MKLPAYVHLSRHNVYVFRRRIPSYLLQYFKTNELRVSLATKCIKDATARARIFARDSDILFYSLEHNMPIDNKSPFMQLIENKKKDVYRQEKIEQLENMLAESAYMRTQQAKQYERDIENIKTFRPVLPDSTFAVESKVPLLSELVEIFLSNSEVKRRRDKPATVRKDKDALMFFLSIVGDKKINEVKQSDAALYSKEILTFRSRGKERAVNTVNNHMSSVSKFSAWVAGHHSDSGHVTLDFTKLRYKKRKSARKERPMFEMHEITQIFTHKKLEASRLKDPSKYWLLHILLYNGMRLEEVTQLNPQTDIFKCPEGIWVFKVTEIYDEETHVFKTSIKKDASDRLVPIHSKLIELGLIDYVEKIKSTATRMFPDTKVRDDRTGKNLGKKVNYYISTMIGIKKSLHSFRHTFITLLKRAGVEESVAAAIVGHHHGSVTYGRYGKDYLSSTLKEVLERHIKFDF